MIRSVLAVLAGYLVMVIAIVALFAVSFRSPDQVPTSGFMLLAVAYALPFAVLGGYVCGLIAKSAPIRHAMALVALSLVMWVISFLTEAGREPLWFQLANLVVMVCGVLAGGYIRGRQMSAMRSTRISAS